MEDLKIWQDCGGLQLNYLIGVDEVGRGPLFGPVVAAAIRITPCSNHGQGPEDILNWLKGLGVGDSKKLTATKRVRILGDVFGTQFESQKTAMSIEKCGWLVEGRIEQASVLEIDQINILHAAMLAMSRAIRELGRLAKDRGVILVDGNRNPLAKDPIVGAQVICLVKGDARSLVIGLASILAKEYRDTLITQMSHLYPGYGLEKHAGYPTPEHLQALSKLGPTSEHRKSFGPVRKSFEQGAEIRGPL